MATGSGDERLGGRLLVAVGSRHDQVCSIGAFARAEARALRGGVFDAVDVLEPDSSNRYPRVAKVTSPDFIFFHAPALHDRLRPWNALTAALKLRRAFPRSKFISVVHEFFEAPAHWRVRQLMLLKLSDAVVVNCEPDLAALRRWHKNILKSHLGPTLYFSELLDAGGAKSAISSRLEALRAGARAKASERFKIAADERWLLHPGLVTPGKGVDALARLAPFLGPGTRMIVMGGLGPKQRDRDFANAVLRELESRLGSRLTFVESPSDEVYREMLVAADLVVLPYDVGVTERRSSFLSAASCGANIWTTVGAFSKPFGVFDSGAHRVEASAWKSGHHEALKSVEFAINENPHQAFERRLSNLKWASSHSWKKRGESLARFLGSLNKS